MQGGEKVKLLKRREIKLRNLRTGDLAYGEKGEIDAAGCYEQLASLGILTPRLESHAVSKNWP